MSLTKLDLLTYLDRSGDVDAGEVASAFGIRYAVAAMGLLRLARQGLAIRERSGAGAYRYRLSDRGRSRLAYLRERTGHEGSRAG